MSGTRFTSTTDLLKVDAELGVVFGYAIVCREKNDKGDWVDHYDTQGHHIPESEMLKASIDFAQQQTIAKAASKDMHEGDSIQEVVQMIAVTEELAKALDWDIKKTGLVIALKPTPEILELYKADPASAPDFRTGFSMGGTGVLEEVD
jgi:hypothetical protein